MPTIMTHAVVPIAAGFALGRARITRPVVVAGALLAMLPDADVIGFAMGVDYADPLGHRGASHALLVAGVVAAIMTGLMRPARAGLAFAFLFTAMASHGLLDAFTNGGLGPALFWPFDSARHFAPVTPIKVSPIGVGFFSARGVAVLLSEAAWVWLPAIGLATLARLAFWQKDRV